MRKTAVHVVVRGRVQGVGFRRFVERIARASDLAGWVRNRADGGVEVLAEGPAADLAALCARLQVGPHGALVREVADVDAEAPPATRPFTILHH